jgi:hypothetical protein
MSFEKFESKNAYTGKQFEEELLAEVTCGWDGEGWIKADKDQKDKIVASWLHENIPDVSEKQWRYMRPEEKRDVIVGWAKEHQPENWDPGSPYKFKEARTDENKDPQIDNKVMLNLHDLLAEELGLEDYNELKLCTTLHTPADTLYGIDGFFEWKGTVFTIDLTVNQSKAESGVGLEKADWVLTLNDPEDESELQEKAKRMADSLKLKIKMAEMREKRQRAA